MSGFSCPVCGQPLKIENRAYVCPSGHSHDISKYGYVNLLLSSQSGLKRHGDDKLMVKARREFLDKGYYGSLLKCLCREALPYVGTSVDLLDAGCGDCFYSSALYNYFCKKGVYCRFFGVDISKDALVVASKRTNDISLAVASVFSLPLADSTIDMALNFFAPCPTAELNRVLRPGGILIRAVPLERHLMVLKEALYAEPYENKPSALELEGFSLKKVVEIRTVITVQPREDIQNLFKMTPYYYKTSREDQEKADGLDCLKTEVEFGLRIYENSAE